MTVRGKPAVDGQLRSAVVTGIEFVSISFE